MKKNILGLSMLLLLAGGSVFANGMVFDPTEFPLSDEIQVAKDSSTGKTPSVTVLPSNKSIENDIKESTNYSQDAVSSQQTNFNNALVELDSAQINIRNELLEYQSKFQEVDTQYQLIKEQRRVLQKQINSIKKRINAIEKSKNSIRKSMI